MMENVGNTYILAQNSAVKRNKIISTSVPQLFFYKTGYWGILKTFSDFLDDIAYSHSGYFRGNFDIQKSRFRGKSYIFYKL